MISRTGLHRFSALLFLIFLALPLASVIAAQQQRERTLEEIKTEAIKRAENGMYPLIGLDPADLRLLLPHFFYYPPFPCSFSSFFLSCFSLPLLSLSSPSIPSSFFNPFLD